MIELTPIGHVRSPHRELGSTPIQARLDPEAMASIEVLPDFAAGLEGLEGFDFAWMLTILHVDREIGPNGGSDPLRPVPFLVNDPGQQLGVFATRYPVRPNPLGLSLIEIDRIDDGTVHFSGLDVVDGTPVVDLKPWVPAFDLPDPRSAASFDHVRIGWYADSKLKRPDRAVRRSGSSLAEPADADLER